MGEVAEMVPSVELVRALVEGPDGSGERGDRERDVEQQLAEAAAWERVISWASARQAQVLVEIDRTAEVTQYGLQTVEAARSLGDQLGLALGVSGGSAQRRLVTAATWTEKIPAVHRALQLGAITVHHARLAASAAAVLTPELTQDVAAATLADPHWRTPSEFAATFARYVIELDPAGAEARRRVARRTRRVSHRPEPDGMSALWALLPAEDCEAVYARIDACARSSSATNTPGDLRTLEERRADALVQLVCGQISNGFSSPASGDPADAPTSEPTVQGRRPTICVTVAWSTLIGLDDKPAHLTGYGPIDAATSRRIAADPTATWYRLLTDAVSGQLLDHGRTVYRPPQDLRDFVTARDRCCRFPGCDRAARTCDLDHRHDWIDGGTTCAEVVDALCRRHHQLRHQGGWAHFRDPETGDSVWFDPNGTCHRRLATVLPTPEPVEPPADDVSAPPAADVRAPRADDVEVPPVLVGAATAADGSDDAPPF